MIFCSEECCRQSSLPEKWEAVCETYQHTQSWEKALIRKQRYRNSPQGIAQRRREYVTRCTKQTAARDLAKQHEDAVHPKPEADASPPEKPDADALLDAIISEPVVMPEVTPDTTETVSPLSPAMPAVSELRQAKHLAILKILFSGKPEPATISSSEGSITVPAGVVPGFCKALGCNEVVVPRSTKTEKRFCSGICSNAFRNTLQNIKEAWSATRCRFLKLLVILFRHL
jgi:hypothetical protein